MRGPRDALSTLRSVVRFKRPELDSVERRLGRAASFADLRQLAKRRLPRGVFDYIDGGAEDERSMAGNAAAFAAHTFRPRVLRDVSSVDTSTTVLGRVLPLPLILAPTGFTRIAHPDGELAVARAGLPYCLSTLATRSIEEVANAAAGDLWFQVYVWRDRALVRDMVERAAAMAFSTLVITVDTAVLGRRERDVRRGFVLPLKIGAGTVLDGVVHPSWTWNLLRSEPITFANVSGPGVGGRRGSGARRLHQQSVRPFPVVA